MPMVCARVVSLGWLAVLLQPCRWPARVRLVSSVTGQLQQLGARGIGLHLAQPHLGIRTPSIHQLLVPPCLHHLPMLRTPSTQAGAQMG